MNSKGYIKGKPVSLTVLDYGLFKVHANGRVIGIVGFLIRTDRDETILVDTGFPAKYAYDIEASSAEDKLGGFGVVLALTDENLPAAQLARAGVAMEDVDLLIMTHTHIDHVGGIADFPDRPILMSAAERALEKPIYWSGLKPLDWPDRAYMLVDGDVDLGPGLKVLAAPGHTIGQLALLVELPETGPVLLTGDAISRPAEIDERFDTADDPTAAIASADRIMRLAAEKGAMVIYGHSPEQWPQLKKSPEFYA
ncbi:N-acyl homoserine lactonase family protein [Rhizobium sp. EC-SD404]|uniref:N-acyl homoserine lactonase family protein n=1 Tax=Rhizobium sp. EC-SD404 TaxID=2038389 RepID=UPI0012593B31|nr:N-acyl homoserine lactonase family protein [Rhizobium sp. EC-SD404]VVT31709.1 Zn-dependent hydrolase [Rhizobium sp. EC-SD404]